MEFKCTLCSSAFSQKRYLQTHLSRAHGIKKDVKNAQSSICIFCGKHFASKKSYANHVAKFHHAVNTAILCQEESCTQKFRTICKLREHLNSAHHLESITECIELNFEKYSDFLNWKEEEEAKSVAKFVINTKRDTDNHKYRYFICNHSGTYQPGDECRKGQLKAQGTKKIGCHCTAAIIVKDLSSHVEVLYYKGHYKHENSLRHVPLPQVQKKLIAVPGSSLLKSILLSDKTQENKLHGKILKLKDSSSMDQERNGSEPGNKKVIQQKRFQPVRKNRAKKIKL